MQETREIFRNFPMVLQLIFYVVALSTSGFFIYGFYLRYKKYRKGRDAGRWNNLVGRLMKAALIMGKNSTVFKRDSYAGLAHWMIFWGFIMLLIGTAIVAFDHDFLRFLGILKEVLRTLLVKGVDDGTGNHCQEHGNNIHLHDGRCQEA